MTSSETKYYVGTSGWQYDHWRGVFYPDGLAKTRWFEHYRAHFNSVEINATFYGRFKDSPGVPGATGRRARSNMW